MPLSNFTELDTAGVQLQLAEISVKLNLNVLNGEAPEALEVAADRLRQAPKSHGLLNNPLAGKTLKQLRYPSGTRPTTHDTRSHSRSGRFLGGLPTRANGGCLTVHGSPQPLLR